MSGAGEAHLNPLHQTYPLLDDTEVPPPPFFSSIVFKIYMKTGKVVTF